MITAALRMFMELGMVQKFKIDYETLCRWLLTVRKNYRMVLYHNWRHAFNVCQLMFAMLTVSVCGDGGRSPGVCADQRASPPHVLVWDTVPCGLLPTGAYRPAAGAMSHRSARASGWAALPP
uniref:Phosphodiesterase 11A n=1 Tax=Molossus molossus TaxID=27622 RepID=A0A7J8FUL6_MOLMO|nr:phosphodiesterase 11A [Molossus molossus]